MAEKTPISLRPSEVIDVVASVIYIRNLGRSAALSHLTLDDVRKEALKFIGSSEEPEDVPIGEPLGRIQQLKLLQRRLDAILERLKSEAESG